MTLRRPMALRRHRAVGILAALVVAVQIAASASGTQFYLTQLTMAAYYSLVVIGLCLLMGYAGQISLGHAGFFAMGGYVSAALSKADLTTWSGTAAFRWASAVGLAGGRVDIYGREMLCLSPWIGFCVAIVATAALAVVIGGPIMRLRGHYLAMATLGLGVIVYRVALGTPALGEADGLSDVPGLRFLPGLEVTGKAAARVENYYIAWCVVAAAMVLSTNLIDSRVGRALRSIHGSEEAANTLGVDTGRYKLWTFVTSAVLAAVGGVLLVHFNGGIGPSESSAMKSVRYVAIVAAGGMDNLWGALLTGTVLNYLSLRGTFGSLDDAVFAGILIVVMLFAPKGLLRVSRGGPRRRRAREGAA